MSLKRNHEGDEEEYASPGTVVKGEDLMDLQTPAVRSSSSSSSSSASILSLSSFPPACLLRVQGAAAWLSGGDTGDERHAAQAWVQAPLTAHSRMLTLRTWRNSTVPSTTSRLSPFPWCSGIV